MINKILEASMRQPGFTLLAAGILLAAGLWSAVHLPIDAVPDITGVQVQVNTEVPALAAEESEQLVTRPIELALAGLPGVEEMRSLTKFGLSQVTIQFQDGTDIYRARPARCRASARRAGTLAGGGTPQTRAHQYGPWGNLLLQRQLPCRRPA